LQYYYWKGLRLSRHQNYKKSKDELISGSLLSHSQLNSSQSLFLGIAVTFADRAVTAQPAAQV
ncbi:hypothetical protein, partial [Microcoleus sp.]|uniref:hypothetical protein n=1 Tax=Microcoleus sp. TaxID=44472 RepID=UPI00403EB247